MRQDAQIHMFVGGNRSEGQETVPLVMRNACLNAVRQSLAVLPFAFAEPFSRLLASPCMKKRWQEARSKASKGACPELATKKGAAAPANVVGVLPTSPDRVASCVPSTSLNGC